MRELSLHILDLVQNSISAGATIIEICVNENVIENIMSFSIRDNGKGMSRELLNDVTDPFVTTRTTRKVGMGISLTKAGCEACDGEFHIESTVSVGTFLSASYRYDHIDRQPLGDIAETVSSLILLNPLLDFIYTHIYNNESFCLDTREVRQTIGKVPIETPEVISFIKGFIEENITVLQNKNNN